MKKYFIFMIGIQLSIIGIILNTRTGLGVASFSTVFYSLSHIFNLSLGTASMILYIILILLQILLYKKISYKLVLQIPYSVIFSLLTDFYNSFIPTFTLSFYQSILLVIMACLFTSLGVYLQVKANVVLTPVEGMVQAISEVFHKEFGNVKNGFDLSMIMITVIMCLVLNQPFYGIGIGTLMSALLIGQFVKIHTRVLNPVL